MCEPKYCDGLLDKNRHRRKPFPFEICNDEEGESFKSRTSDKSCDVLVGPRKWRLPNKYASEAEIFYNFEARPDDVWIISYPCSGAGLLQEMVWLMTHNYDFDKAYEESLDDRSPFFEASILVEDEVATHIHKVSSSPKECLQLLQKYTIPRWQILRDTMKRRIIKTHLPISLLPHNIMDAGCKLIYITRNPKDVIASAFYLNKFSTSNEDTQDYASFCEDFRNDKKFWCPYWEHIAEGAKEKRVLLLRYEDVVKNMSRTIHEVAGYINATVSDEQLCKLIDYLTVQTFKTRASLNQGVLRNYMKYDDGYGNEKNDEDVASTIDEWIESNVREFAIKLPL